jgi:hypothetical protein
MNAELMPPGSGYVPFEFWLLKIVPGRLGVNLY